jgi:hypothetical protein
MSRQPGEGLTHATPVRLTGQTFERMDQAIP